jgi:hypothetical protein
MASLEEHLLNLNVVLISVGAWFILWVLRKVWKGMDSIKIVKRLKPLYPAVLCQGIVWIPGALPAEPEPTIGTRILMALWCGFLASIGYQLLKRFLGQKGIELPDKPEDILPSSDSEDDQPEEDEGDEKDDADADESEAKESRDTPVETPVPKKLAEAEADDSSGSDDSGSDDSGSDD